MIEFYPRINPDKAIIALSEHLHFCLPERITKRTYDERSYISDILNKHFLVTLD